MASSRLTCRSADSASFAQLEPDEHQDDGHARHGTRPVDDAPSSWPRRAQGRRPGRCRRITRRTTGPMTPARAPCRSSTRARTSPSSRRIAARNRRSVKITAPGPRRLGAHATTPAPPRRAGGSKVHAVRGQPRGDVDNHDPRMRIERAIENRNAFGIRESSRQSRPLATARRIFPGDGIARRTPTGLASMPDGRRPTARRRRRRGDWRRRRDVCSNGLGRGGRSPHHCDDLAREITLMEVEILSRRGSEQCGLQAVRVTIQLPSLKEPGEPLLKAIRAHQPEPLRVCGHRLAHGRPRGGFDTTSVRVST